MSWYRAPLWDLRPDYFLSEGCCLKVAVLFLWGALSDERTTLQFAVQSLIGPSCRTLNHTLLSHLRPPLAPTWMARSPYLYAPGTRWPSYTPRAMGSLYVVSYDSRGYGGGILTLPLPGGIGSSIYSLQEWDVPDQSQFNVKVKVTLRSTASQSVCPGGWPCHITTAIQV
jgi:hypothetical protein